MFALSVIAARCQGRVAAPSVCCAVACIPLAAAPTAPPCFRRWRRSSPLPQRGSPWHVGQVYAGRAKYDVPETVVLRCLGQRQLDKVRLSRSRCPRKQGPPFYALSGLRRPVESGPACQRLPLWGSWREAPERASPARKDHPCSDKQTLCQRDAIAAPSNHRQHPCPLRHLR